MTRMPRLLTIHSQAESETNSQATGHGASGCTRDAASEESHGGHGAHSPLPGSPLRVMSMRTSGLVGGCGAGGTLRSPTAERAHSAQAESVVGPYPSPTHHDVAASVGWVPPTACASAPSLRISGLSLVAAGEACEAGASGARPTAPSGSAGVQSHAQAPSASGSMHNHSASVQSSGPSSSSGFKLGVRCASGITCSCGLGSVMVVTTAAPDTPQAQAEGLCQCCQAPARLGAQACPSLACRHG